jgi:hypothetical protein
MNDYIKNIVENEHINAAALIKDDKLKAGLDLLKKQIDEENKARVLIVEGVYGGGKTTTAAVVATYVQPFFNPKTQIGAGVLKFADAWEATQATTARVRAVVFDEGHDINKTSATSIKNQMMNSFFNTYRSAKTLLILCVQTFTELDRRIFHREIVGGSLRIRTIRPGVCVVGDAYDFEGIMLAKSNYKAALKSNDEIKGLRPYDRYIKNPMPLHTFRIDYPGDSYQKVIDEASNAAKIDFIKHSFNKIRAAENIYSTPQKLPSLEKIKRMGFSSYEEYQQMNDAFYKGI